MCDLAAVEAFLIIIKLGVIYLELPDRSDLNETGPNLTLIGLNGKSLQESYSRNAAKGKNVGDSDQLVKVVKTDTDMMMRKCGSSISALDSGEAALESELEAETNAMWELKDVLKKHISTVELRQMLVENDQSTSGSELDLRDCWFITGFFLGGIPWYIEAVFLICCKRSVDPREKPGHIACTVARYEIVNRSSFGELWSILRSLKGRKVAHWHIYQPACSSYGNLSVRKYQPFICYLKASRRKIKV